MNDTAPIGTELPGSVPQNPTLAQNPEAARREPMGVLSDLVMAAWPDPFRAWFQALAQELDDSDPLAVALLDRVGLAAWRLRQLAEHEQAGLDQGLDREGLRARDQADRAFSRVLSDLLRYQAARRGRTRAVPARTPEPSTPSRRRPVSRPSEIGPAPIESDLALDGDGRAADNPVRHERQPASACRTVLAAHGPEDLDLPSESLALLEALAARAPEDWAQRCGIDPEVSRHWPVVRGTRVLAEVIASALVAGEAPASILAEHPGVTFDDLTAVARLERLGRTGPWSGTDGVGPAI